MCICPSISKLQRLFIRVIAAQKKKIRMQLLIKLRSDYINPSYAETGTSRDNWGNTITNFALAHCVVQLSAPMVLSMQDYWFLIFKLCHLGFEGLNRWKYFFWFKIYFSTRADTLLCEIFSVIYLNYKTQTWIALLPVIIYLSTSTSENFITPTPKTTEIRPLFEALSNISSLSRDINLVRLARTVRKAQKLNWLGN